MLLGILWSRYQRNCFHVTKIHIITKHINVKHLPNIFLLLIRSQALFVLEASTDVAQLLVDAEALLLFVLAIANIAYKYR
nr:hypothetical protein Iba_scaffold12494CG0020 [Ipomoea batatas]